jgi:pimeloyl-ACP methyl ester carboxylesterase
MNKYLFAILALAFGLNSYAQSTKPVTYNFGMEEFTPGKTWVNAKGYSSTPDTQIKHSGKMSLLMQQTDSVNAGPSSTCLFLRPDKYLGSEIEVRAWLKFENVKDFVALMVKVTDEDGNALQFKSLQSKHIHGTKDWALYSVKVPLAEHGETLVFGSILSGPGKLWTDDMQVLIDGKDITRAPINPDFNPNPPKLPKYGSNPAASGTVKLKDATLYYEIYGTGQPLLLLHGDSQSIFAFSKQIPELSKHFKVIAVDTRGQGKSTDLTTGPLSYDLFANDMKQLLDSLHVPKTDILGWSDGGNTGLLIAIKYPSYVNKLAVTGANLEPTDQAVEHEVLKGVSDQLADWKKDTSAYAAMEVRLFTMMLNEPHISVENLRSIKAPVLVMAGEHDVILEKHTKLIASSIPNATLYIFKDASHYVPVEKIDEFNNKVISYFEAP